MDHFNLGQADRLAAALGDRATLRAFTAAESAGIHAHPGASVLVNGVVLDWLTEALDATQPREFDDGRSRALPTRERQGAYV